MEPMSSTFAGTIGSVPGSVGYHPQDCSTLNNTTLSNLGRLIPRVGPLCLDNGLTFQEAILPEVLMLWQDDATLAPRAQPGRP